jgi:hypothetical protein
MLIFFHTQSSGGVSVVPEQPGTITISTAGVRYLIGPPSDPGRVELLGMPSQSQALAFWRNEAEDIYKPTDGEPVEANA